MMDGRFPYVRIHEATGLVYSKASEFLIEVKGLFEREQATLPPRCSLPWRRTAHWSLKSIEDFRVNLKYAGDHTRIDLAYAVYALAQGIAEYEVRAAVASRDLTHKGNRKRQQEYIDRTIKKARERIGDYRKA